MSEGSDVPESQPQQQPQREQQPQQQEGQQAASQDRQRKQRTDIVNQGQKSPAQSAQHPEQQLGKSTNTGQNDWQSGSKTDQFRASLQKSLASDQAGQDRPKANKTAESKPQLDSPDRPGLRLEQPNDKVVNPAKTNVSSPNVQDKAVTKAKEANKKEQKEKQVADNPQKSPDKSAQTLEQQFGKNGIESPIRLSFINSRRIASTNVSSLQDTVKPNHQTTEIEKLYSSDELEEVNRLAEETGIDGLAQKQGFPPSMPPIDARDYKDYIWAQMKENSRGGVYGNVIEAMAVELDATLKRYSSMYSFVSAVIKEMGKDDLDDDLAALLVERISDPRLQEYTHVPAGREMMDVLYAAMITGKVSSFERKQAKRLRDAKQETFKDRTSQEEFLKTHDGGLMIFPVRNVGLREAIAVFKAELTPSGKVKLWYPSERLFWYREKFEGDLKSLEAHGYGEKQLESAIYLDPERIVAVRLYDEGRTVIDMPALELIDYSNQLERNAVEVGATAFFLGLTLGLGALGGEAIHAAKVGIETGTATKATLWAMRGLVWADRVFYSIQAGAMVINSNRDWILENVPQGQALLDAVDTANMVAGYYGWGRLTVDTIRVLRNKLLPAANSWRKATARRTDLSPADQKLTRAVEDEADTLLAELAHAEEEAAKVAKTGTTSPSTTADTPLSRPVAGFGRPIQPLSRPAPPISRPVAGFGRKIEPQPGTAPQEPPTVTQMPPAKRMPSSPGDQGIIGQRRDQPTRAIGEPKTQQPAATDQLDTPSAAADESVSQNISRRTQRQQRESERQRPLDPRTQEQVNLRREADSIFENARAGEYRSASEKAHKKLLDRFERLMLNSGASKQAISSRKGRLNELLRTPTGAQQARQAQPEYLAGGPRLPDQGRKGTARPDFTDTRQLPDGRIQRVHVNDKSDNIHQMNQSQAVQRARRYTDDAVVQSRGAQVGSAAPRQRLRQGPRVGPLPEGESIVIRYTHSPDRPIQEAVVREHFRPDSPISEVHFGSTVFKRRSMNSSDFDRL
jgi:hypothetical protein